MRTVNNNVDNQFFIRWRVWRLRHANVYRTAARGGVDRRNIDPDDSEIVKLHRRDLSDRDRHLRTGANVKRCLTSPWRRLRELEQRKLLSRKGGHVDVELGRNFSCDRAHRRPFGP